MQRKNFTEKTKADKELDQILAGNYSKVDLLYQGRAYRLFGNLSGHEALAAQTKREISRNHFCGAELGAENTTQEYQLIDTMCSDGMRFEIEEKGVQDSTFVECVKRKMNEFCQGPVSLGKNFAIIGVLALFAGCAVYLCNRNVRDERRAAKEEDGYWQMNEVEMSELDGHTEVEKGDKKSIEHKGNRPS